METKLFEGVPSPVGAILILIPLIYSLAELDLSFSLISITHI